MSKDCYLRKKGMCTGRHYRDEASDVFHGFLSNQKAQKQFKNLRQTQGETGENPIDIDSPLLKAENPFQTGSDSMQGAAGHLHLQHF